MPLSNLTTHALLALLFAPTLALATARAQTAPVPAWQTAAGGKQTFEVASIHPTKPDDFTSPTFPLSADDSFRSTHGFFSADFPVTVYIEFAYKLFLSREQRDALVAHLPRWVPDQAFSIHAKVPVDATKDQIRLMMQSLLADRFHLAVHFETRDVPVLVLSLIHPGKLGANIRLHSQCAPCDVQTASATDPTRSSPAVTDGILFPCHSFTAEGRPDNTVIMGSRDTTPALLASSLPNLADLGRPVVDQTGLTGRYDFALDFASTHNAPTHPSTTTPPSTAEANPGPTFYEALKDQLGMKLKPAKLPLPVLIIDHIDLPSDN